MGWLDKFNLTETERKGYIALLFILAIFLVARIAMALWPTSNQPFQSTLASEMEVWELEKMDRLRVHHSFDPNTVSDSVIATFALSEFVIKNWLAYRERGRNFIFPADVLKIYGMDSLWFRINQDSIIISDVKEAENEENDYSLMDFDPNTTSEQGFIKLGFPEWLANRIVKYRNAGGQFKKPQDLMKIYDFPEELYQRVKPYIQIKTVEPDEKEVSEEETLKVFDLNTIDSIQLISIKGIGPAFASRILDYRNKLGGYFNIDQLTEVYGLDAERVASFRERLAIQTLEIKKLDVNTATFKELVAHPYLNYNQVKVIARYRETIGKLKNLRDLLNLEYFEEKDIERLTPYLSVE